MTTEQNKEVCTLKENADNDDSEEGVVIEETLYRTSVSESYGYPSTPYTSSDEEKSSDDDAFQSASKETNRSIRKLKKQNAVTSDTDYENQPCIVSEIQKTAITDKQEDMSDSTERDYVNFPIIKNKKPQTTEDESATSTVNDYVNFPIIEDDKPLTTQEEPSSTSTVKVEEVNEEGKQAIDSPGSPHAGPPDLPPQDYVLEENEERSMIEPVSYDDPKLKQLMEILIEWINDELAPQRIIVKDIEEDLYDGQVLQKLLEKLTGVKLDVIEVTQSEEGQKQKLKTVLDAVQKVLGLGRWSQPTKWSVDAIHSKNVVAILHLLVSLARHFRAPIRLPENVVINVVVVQKRDGILQTRTVPEELTATYDDLGLKFDRDAFDTLFDHAPDKLQVVKKSLVTFVNKQLNKINLEVNDLDTQFHDGVYLSLLMGLLEGYFVPLFCFTITPTNFDQKVHNVSFAFELMMDAGLAKPKARPEDIVNGDLKSTLRVLYNLFTKYKHLS